MISLPPASLSQPTVTCGLKVPSVPGSELALTENFISKLEMGCGISAFSFIFNSERFKLFLFFCLHDKRR